MPRRHTAPTQRLGAGRERCEPGSTSPARISVGTRGNKSGPGRQDTAPAPEQQLAARPVTSPPGPVRPPPWRSRLLLLPAAPHRAPLDVAHVPDPGPRAPSAPARTPSPSSTRPAAGRAAYLRGLMVALLARVERGRGCEYVCGVQSGDGAEEGAWTLSLPEGARRPDTRDARGGAGPLSTL